MKHLKTVLVLGVIAMFLGGSMTSSLQANEVVKQFPAGGAADVLANPKKDKDCRTSEGKTVFKGDPAYEACLKEKLEKPKK